MGIYDTSVDTTPISSFRPVLYPVPRLSENKEDQDVEDQSTETRPGNYFDPVSDRLFTPVTWFLEFPRYKDLQIPKSSVPGTVVFQTLYQPLCSVYLHRFYKTLVFIEWILSKSLLRGDRTVDKRRFKIPIKYTFLRTGTPRRCRLTHWTHRKRPHNIRTRQLVFLGFRPLFRFPYFLTKVSVCPRNEVSERVPTRWKVLLPGNKLTVNDNSWV